MPPLPPTPLRHLPDDERRARLARRHGLTASSRLADADRAARAVVVLHATDPGAVHLAVAARTEAVSAAAVDGALHHDRTLVRQFAMRRTQFVVPRDLLPALWASAGARTAGFERRALARDLLAAGVTDDPEAWFATARAAVLDLLGEQAAAEAAGARVGSAAVVGLSAAEVRAAIPQLGGTVHTGLGTKWETERAVAPRVLVCLGAEGTIVRATNDGPWWTLRPRWTTTPGWLGDDAVPTGTLTDADGYVELVRRWLAAFGPGTEADIVWWLGATKTAVRGALAGLGAVAVTLDGGAVGWLLPDDVEGEPPVERWAALLPSLDPTTMGWTGRGAYLDPALRPYLFDSVGNAGTTAWVDGRIVGCWIQDDGGTVEVQLRADVDRAGRALLAAEAQRLTAWLDGQVVPYVYRQRQAEGRTLP